MWSHVVIEGHCFGKFACGHTGVSPFCLGYGNTKCPHLGWAPSNEREAALCVPLRYIIWDRLVSLACEGWRKTTWHVWHRWFYDPRSIERYRVVGQDIQDRQAKADEVKQAKFADWFETIITENEAAEQARHRPRREVM